MTRTSVRAMAAAAASLAFAIVVAAPARADFNSAVAAYAAKRLDEARAEFLNLAALGDGASQFNLGAMSMRGEGVEKDRATAVGWMLASLENGYAAGMPRERLEAARASFTPEETARMNAVLKQYGKEAIAARALPPAPDRWLACDASRASVIAVPSLGPAVAFDPQDGIVILEATIGVDGLARDPEVLMAVPSRTFERDALRTYLRGRYQPALLDGRPVEMRAQFKYVNEMRDGGMLWNAGAFRRIKQGADDGDASSQYVVGMAAVMDSSLKLPPTEARAMVLRAAQGGIADAQYWVARQFDAGAACRDRTRFDTWLEESAARGLPRAQVLLARTLLERVGDVARARTLVHAASTSKDPYALKHAIALSVDPRLAPVDVAALHDAGRRLADVRFREDPAEEEAIAAAAAAGGDWSEAVKLQKHALDLAGELAWNTSAMAERLARYQARQTWSGDLLALPPRTTAAPPVNGRTLEICEKNCKERRADELAAPTGTHIPR
jgi:TPR repeat protein